MSLDVVHVGAQYAGTGERSFHDTFLRGAVRDGKPRAGAVLVDGRAFDYCPDSISVGFRFGQPLQHHHPAAFASNISVGGLVEGVALSGWGKHANFSHEPGNLLRQDYLHAAGEGQVHFSALQGGCGLVYRRQR